MRVAVVGAGGVGGYFGGKLAAAGVDVAFVARGEHLKALRERGLEVRGPGETFSVPPLLGARATDDPAAIGPVDLVLVAVKTWQLEDAFPVVRALTGPATSVLPLLNGVEAPEKLAAAVGPERVLGGLCAVMSWVAAPGVIEHLGVKGTITFGEVSGGRTPRVDAIQAMFERAKVASMAVDDVVSAMWRKLAFIASVGGAGAVTRAPAGAVRSVPEARAMLERAIAEVYDVGRAHGVAFPEGVVAGTMRYVDGLPADGLASMARDLFAGRRSELDAWSGAIVRLARAKGVDAPVHGFFYASLLPQELRARGALAF